MPVARPRPDRHPRRGAVVHWLVASLVIVTIVALGMDGGRIMEERRHARAVAVGRPAKIGLILLRPTGADAFLNKALALVVINQPVSVNSTDPKAYNQASLGAVVASSINVTGGFVNTGGAIMIAPVRTG